MEDSMMTPRIQPARTLALCCTVLTLAACAESPAAFEPSESPLAAVAAAPVRLEFHKCMVDPAGVWEGQVTGDIDGDLQTVLTDLRVTGAIWHVRFDWIIAGDDAFTADLAGTLNTRTGTVVMNGRVADGHLLGARVHEQGQLVDPVNSCFAGTIDILPATAR
jgi:hypothetical protein